MKYQFFLLALFPAVLFAQRNPTPSDSIVVTGKLRQPMIIFPAGLSRMQSHAVGDVTITNHKGEVKSVARGLRGVLLKDVLLPASWDTLKPRDLSEFYLVCTATDGYKVVFSWNELFNTETGNQVFLITERDGKPIAAMEDRILLLCPADFYTGRRHVKALSRIAVRRAE